MDITSAPIGAELNGLNVVKNFALKFMFFCFKLLLAEDSVGNRVSKNVTNLGNPETSNPRNR